jgi:hypothetical protein
VSLRLRLGTGVARRYKIGLANGNIHAATVFSARLTGATGQESLQKVQAHDLRAGDPSPFVFGRNCLGNLASAEVGFIGSAQTESATHCSVDNLEQCGDLSPARDGLPPPFVNSVSFGTLGATGRGDQKR